MKTLFSFLRGNGKCLVFCFIYIFVFQTSVYALPQGGVVESGSATFDQPNATTLNVNTSDKAIVNWQSFNIAGNETVNFVQPSSMSAALNRVTGGGGASMLNGVLNANGTIILVNPAGVNIGQSAIINVGSMQTSLTGAQAASFIASSMNMSSNDFLNGQYIFAKTGMTNASVINSGMINVAGGGLVMLLGGHVANNGSINAQLGKVVMASGDKVTVNFGTKGLIAVVIDERVAHGVIGIDGKEIKEAVKNIGTISAEGGQIILTADAANGIFDRAVNNEGIIKANTAIVKDGVIELVSTTGTTINSGVVQAKGTADNPDGGKISVYGYTAVNNGVIDVGAGDGGTAGYASLLSDKGGTLLTGESAIYANGKDIMSNAGEVIVNSERITYFAKDAVIDVSGGLVSGDGGFAEISAKDQIGVYGNVLGKAREGYKMGSLLIDPDNGTIQAPGDAAPNAQVLATGLIGIVDFPGLDISVSPASITGFGGNVDLSFQGNCSVNETVNLLGLGSFRIHAWGLITVAAPVSADGVTIESTGGNVVTNAGADITSSGAVTISAFTNDVTTNGKVTAQGGELAILAANDLIVNDTVDGQHANGVDLDGNNSVTINAGVTSPAGFLDIRSINGTVDINDSVAGQTTQVRANTTLTSNASGFISSTNSPCQLTSDTGAVNIGATVSSINGRILINAGDPVFPQTGSLTVADGVSLLPAAGQEVRIFVYNGDLTFNQGFHGNFDLLAMGVQATSVVRFAETMGTAGDPLSVLTVRGIQMFTKSGEVTLNGAQYEYTQGDLYFGALAGTFNGLNLVAVAPPAPPAAAFVEPAEPVSPATVSAYVNESDKTTTEYQGTEQIQPVTGNYSTLIKMAPITWIPVATQNVLAGSTITHTITPPSSAERLADNIAAYQRAMRTEKIEEPEEIRIITFENKLLSTHETAVIKLDFNTMNVFMLNRGVRAVQGIE